MRSSASAMNEPQVTPPPPAWNAGAGLSRSMTFGHFARGTSKTVELRFRCEL